MGKQIKSFFEDIDNSILDTPKQLAIEYLNFVFDNKDSCLHDRNNTYFVTSDDSQLSDITKRCFLLSDRLSLSCKSDKSIRYAVDYSGYPYKDRIGYFAFENDFESLGIWIKNVKDLLITEKLYYYPNIYKYVFNHEGEMKEENADIITDIMDVTTGIKQSRVFSRYQDCYSDLLLNNDLVMQLEIPIVDNVSMGDFINIIFDNPDSIEQFRRFFANEIRGINFKSKGEIKELSKEIQNRAVMLGKQNKTIEYKLLKKAAFLLPIGTIKIILYIIKPEIAEMFMATPYGTLGCEFSELLRSGLNARKEKKELKKDDVYFLWLLNKSQQ